MGDRLLNMLQQSGKVGVEDVARRLNIPPDRVCVIAEELRGEGYKLEFSQDGAALKIIAPHDSIWPCALAPQLTTRWCGREIEYQDVIGSTNIRAKELARSGAAHGTLVLANEQTGGRGRMQRHWVSEPSVGIWMSLILCPTAVEAQRISFLVMVAALAVARACREEVGDGVLIKWPNDIVFGDKKVSGTLLEMGASGAGVDWAVIGMGINVLNSNFPQEIEHKAGSLYQASGKKIERSKLLCEVLSQFEALYDGWLAGKQDAILSEYKRISATIGRSVRAIYSDREIEGTAVGVRADGTLVVRTDAGEDIVLHAGDVSVRGKTGYV